jgi:hypothetical protein
MSHQAEQQHQQQPEQKGVSGNRQPQLNIAHNTTLALVAWRFPNASQPLLFRWRAAAFDRVRSAVGKKKL